jgi:ubiquinone/menaquinone biosynthesis C-methylase UbiE
MVMRIGRSRAYRRRLAHGRRLWNLTAGGHRADTRMGRAQQAQWRLAVRALDLSEGEVVVDLGCGAGSAFAALRDAVGASGRVVGTEYSPKMLARARATIAEHGWANVEVRHADASADPLEPGGYDAAIAAYSLSAMPDLPAAIEHLHAALRPDGRVFVGDVYFSPRMAGRVLRHIYRTITAGNGDDIATALRARFDTVNVVTDDNGRTLAARSDKTWPPITYLVARKTAR